MTQDEKKDAALAEINAVLDKYGLQIGIDAAISLIPLEEAEKGTQENPFTREEAVEAGIDVVAAEAEAVLVEEPVA